MWLEVITRLQPAQASGFGPGDWIALSLAVALLLAAFVGPNVVNRLASRRGERRPDTGGRGRVAGTAA
ncbi:MAG TPA: hypothetical protein VOB72_16445 [Candidatus Dormibacteraeota bacterium]|nr:hypothetical protein [Candidatus Dormibacteraeota bacterium]